MSNFELIVLGCMGGPLESNLSGYLLSTAKFREFIALDAGTLLAGLTHAFKEGSFADYSFNSPALFPEKELLLEHLQGYLISHAHLDHIAGLVINSQMDSTKTIYALDETIGLIKEHIFNGKIWPNYGNEGEGALSKYNYCRVYEGQSKAIAKTDFVVTPFPLNHGKHYPSTAFLIEGEGAFLLYFGDTTSDSLSNVKRLDLIWKKIAPLIDTKQLKGILLECSYAHESEGDPCFGHLDSNMMMEELRALRHNCSSLEGLKVVVTHSKQTFLQPDQGLGRIREQLLAQNDLGIDFIFPRQGMKISF